MASMPYRRMEPPRAAGHVRRVLADPFQAIIGCSPAAEAMRTFGRRAATVDAPVLILGESGTGKGVLASCIHRASPRASRPFIPVNCAAVPETLFESEFFGHVRGAFTGAQYTHKGLFEQAHTGTLFLDEIGELGIPGQAKLLTVLEDRVVRRVGAERVAAIDFRVIAATASDLQQQIGARQFRSDLFHRLSILLFEIPPLRHRREDIPMLAEHLVQSIARRYQRPAPELTPAAIDYLQLQSWPGNVREFSNVVERAVVLRNGQAIAEHHLTASTARATRIGAPPPAARYSFVGSLEQERAHIAAAVAACRGNKTRAASMLGMSRNTLLNKLRTS